MSSLCHVVINRAHAQALRACAQILCHFLCRQQHISGAQVFRRAAIMTLSGPQWAAGYVVGLITIITCMAHASKLSRMRKS